MAHHRLTRGNHPSLGHTPEAHVTKMRLVFGPASTVPELLAAAAAALDPFDLVPTALEYAATHDGYRLRVSFELDTRHTDVSGVLARLLPASWMCRETDPFRTATPRRLGRCAECRAVGRR